MDRTPSPDLPPQQGQTSSARRRNTMFTPQYAFGTSEGDTMLSSIQQEQRLDTMLDEILKRPGQNLKALRHHAKPLLKDFSKCFPEPTAYIRECIPAMQWVAEAAKAGVSFGGYAEDGPRSNTQSYALDKRVYVPKTQTDPILVMKDFLFELKNGLNAAKFNAIVSKASRREITPEEYARRMVQIEVEGVWGLAEIWTQMKPQIEKISKNPINLDNYDDLFYLTERKRYENENYSKDEILEEKLNSVYQSGRYAGMTTRQFYIQQYDAL